jgi:hypothetical protein
MNEAKLEERLKRLERFRYRTLGMISAQNTMLIDLWCNWLQKNDPDLPRTLEKLRNNWLASAERPSEDFHNIDPAHLDLVAQEYRDALVRLTNEMIRRLGLARETGQGNT